MPALKPTDFVGKLVWLGVIPSREPKVIEPRVLEEMDLTFAGVAADVHAGLTRPSCVRVAAQYRRGTEIRNTRQVSIVSAEELAQIAERLDMDMIEPGWLGATMMIEGIPDFTHIPPSSRLQFEGGATLTVDMENRPCSFVRDTIASYRPGEGEKFVSAARGRRGITAWVEREGRVQLGESVRLHVPDQRGWKP